MPTVLRIAIRGESGPGDEEKDRKGSPHANEHNQKTGDPLRR
jgi:hypothetical protein